MREKIISTLKGAMIAMGGAAIAAGLAYASSIDWGEYGPWVAAMAAVIINAVRQWLRHQPPDELPPAPPLPTSYHPWRN